MPIIKNTGTTYLKEEGYENLRSQAAVSVKLSPEIDALVRWSTGNPSNQTQRL